MVRVEVAVPVPGVMLAGENEQRKLLGKPPHESEIWLFNVPDFIAAVTVTLPDLPIGRVMSVGDALKDIVVGTGGAGLGGAGGAGAGGVGTGAVLGHVGL